MSTKQLFSFSSYFFREEGLVVELVILVLLYRNFLIHLGDNKTPVFLESVALFLVF